jgi:hypothetical protein
LINIKLNIHNSNANIRKRDREKKIGSENKKKQTTKNLKKDECSFIHRVLTQKVQLLFHKEREKEGDKNPIIKAKVGLKNKEQQSLAVVVVGGVVFFVSQNYCC